MTRTWILAVLAIVFAVAGLTVAEGSERFAGLVPCALCLLERWPYRVAMVFGFASLVPFRRGVDLRVILWGVVLCMAVSVVFASVHVGVEQGWWPSPLPECAAPDLGGGTVAERLARMPARPAKPCDDPTYLWPGVPLSMAAMNGLASLVFGLFLAISLRHDPYGADNERHPARRPHPKRAPRPDDPRRSRR